MGAGAAASCLVAVGVRPSAAAMESSGTANRSCSAKVTRAAGLSASNTT